MGIYPIGPYWIFCIQIESIAKIQWTQKNQNTKYIPVSIYSEYKRKNTIFRCHPMFRSEQPWFDWVMVRWQNDSPTITQPDLLNNISIKYFDNLSGNQFCYTQCKILGYFYKVPISDKFENFCVVWPTTWKFKQSSVFTNEWEMDLKDHKKTIPALQVINCDSIVRHCCMIPDSLESKNNYKYHELWPRELWGEQF